MPTYLYKLFLWYFMTCHLLHFILEFQAFTLEMIYTKAMCNIPRQLPYLFSGAVLLKSKVYCGKEGQIDESMILIGFHVY